MSKFSAAVRHTAFVTALLAWGCDGGDDPADAAMSSIGTGGTGGTGGVRDARADSMGGNRGDAPGDVSAEAPVQDVTPVMIQRPVVVRRGTRLRGFFVQSAEGAQERWLLWDSMLNTRCGVSTADDGKPRCLPPLPSGWALDSYFARYTDADCTTPALPEAPACASGFGYKLLPTGRAVHRLGPAVEVTTLYSRVTVNGVPMCEAKPLPQPRRFFTLGEQIPATMFVERLSSRADGPQTQRMKPVYAEMADGTRVLGLGTEAWDTDMEAYCRVLTADDGWLRCLPSVTMTASAVTFSDDKCTRTAGLSLSETPEKFATLVVGAGCEARRRIFRGPATPTPLPTIYRILNERCTAMPQTATSTIRYFAVGEELPAQRFAAFRPARVGGGRLQERYFVGEEGVAVRELNNLWDSQLNQPCSFDLTSSGRRCVPFGWSLNHADAGCKNRVGAAAARLCSEPITTTPMNSLNVGSWCAPVAAPHALAAALDPPDGGASTSLYVRSLDDSCTQSGSQPTGYRAIGDPVDLNMFAPGMEAMD